MGWSTTFLQRSVRKDGKTPFCKSSPIIWEPCGWVTKDQKLREQEKEKLVVFGRDGIPSLECHLFTPRWQSEIVSMLLFFRLEIQHARNRLLVYKITYLCIYLHYLQPLGYFFWGGWCHVGTIAPRKDVSTFWMGDIRIRAWFCCGMSSWYCYMMYSNKN